MLTLVVGSKLRRNPFVSWHQNRQNMSVSNDFKGSGCVSFPMETFFKFYRYWLYPSISWNINS